MAMRAALFLVIAMGAGIGSLVPIDRAPTAPATAPTAAAPAPPASSKPDPVAAANRPAAPQPLRETRLLRQDNGHFQTLAMVNGQPVQFVVDTGATSVALTVADARRIGIPVDESAFEVIGTGASGEVYGQRITLGSVDVDGKHVTQVPAAVLDGLGVSLLGQTYLSRITSVTMSGDYMTLR